MSEGIVCVWTPATSKTKTEKIQFTIASVTGNCGIAQIYNFGITRGARSQYSIKELTKEFMEEVIINNSSANVKINPTITYSPEMHIVDGEPVTLYRKRKSELPYFSQYISRAKIIVSDSVKNKAGGVEGFCNLFPEYWHPVGAKVFNNNSDNNIQMWEFNRGELEK